MARGVTTIIVAGDCTDLCIFHAATGPRLWANASGRSVRHIVPANLVDTYHLPVDVAGTIGAMPPDGDPMRAAFPCHRHLNSIEVIRSITVH